MRWLKALFLRSSGSRWEDQAEHWPPAPGQDCSDANWQRLPPELRRRLLRSLRVFLRSLTVEQLREAVGSPFWHFDGGMQVRNHLRTHVPDGALPEVRQPDGHMARNWDDYYMGAIHAILEGRVE